MVSVDIRIIIFFVIVFIILIYLVANNKRIYKRYINNNHLSISDVENKINERMLLLEKDPTPQNLSILVELMRLDGFYMVMRSTAVLNRRSSRIK